MKEIKAFIKPVRIRQIITALKEKGFDSITLSKSEGTGVLKGPDAFPSLEFKVTDSTVVKLELVCPDDQAEQIVQIICKHGRSTEPGDGIIYVSEVEKAFKIKTGEPITKF